MTRLTVAIALIAFCFTLGFAADAAPSAPAAPAAKAYGKALTITEVTPIAKLNAEPAKYKDQNVLVAGKVINVCQGVGCWLEVESDSARVICKSMDESIHFPKDCAGSMVRVQGKVLFDEKATGEAKMMKDEKGMAPHACPNPKVKVSIDGAELTLVTAPKTDAKVELKDAKAEVKEAKAEVKEAKAEVKEAKAEVKDAKKELKEEKK